MLSLLGSLCCGRAGKFEVEEVNKFIATSGTHDELPIHCLPPELVVRTLNFAAASSTEFCLTLCTLSSWTRGIAIPHLVATVILANKRKEVLFDRFLQSGGAIRPPYEGFSPALMVKSLWLPETDFEADLAEGQFDSRVFAPCSNITHLSTGDTNLWAILTNTPPKYFPLPLRDLHLTIRSVFDSDSIDMIWELLLNQKILGKPADELCCVIKMVTHVRVDNFSLARHVVLLFPRLTHLAMPLSSLSDYWYNDELVEPIRLALASPNIKRLVAVLSKQDFQTLSDGRVVMPLLACREQDPRLYFVTRISSDLQQEWKEEVEGGTGIWERATVDTKSLCRARGT